MSWRTLEFMKIRNVRKYLSHPIELFYKLARKGYCNWMPDRLYLKLMYRRFTGSALRLDNPITFNEKLQWMKLYDRKDIYTTMVDKAAVKDFVAEKIGEKYVVPTIKICDRVEDLDFDALPDQFVIKCTHDSGGLVICKDKNKLDRQDAIGKLKKCLEFNYFPLWREWPYKNVVPRIIVEELLNDGKDSIDDYKVMCFNGVPKLIQLHMGRFSEHTQDFYDVDWNRLPIIQGTPMAEKAVDKPSNLEEMLELSAKLSSGIPQVRVDWYCVGGKLYFGELTFFDASGFENFEPEEYNEILGSWIKFPPKK